MFGLCPRGATLDTAYKPESSISATIVVDSSFLPLRKKTVKILVMADKYAASGGNFTATIHSTSYDYISPLKLDLSGRHVLITGVAYKDGVGYATATAFARAGASVIALADHQPIASDLIEDLKAAATQAGRKEPAALPFIADISSPFSVQDLHESVKQALDNRLDILVNNAAYSEPTKPLLDSDPDVYWRTWEVNVHGLFNMARTFLPTLLLPGGLSTMINLSSSGALSARPAGGSYRTSKLTILRWTESLQLECESQGLLTYCVNPGSIRTQLSSNIPDAVRAMLRDHPSIAGDTIAWLASQRKEWLGGRYVSCPWDMEELMAKKDEIVEQDKLKLRMVF